MKPDARPILRFAASSAGVAVLVAACTSSPSPTPAPTVAPFPSRRPAATPTPAPTLAPTQTADPFAGALPLREDLQLPEGEFMVSPDSPTGLSIGVAMPFTLGHCGLYSPVDVDGSLWEPVGGVDANGREIDTDAEVGQLINGTAGEVMLVTSDRLDWRATRAPRVVVVFQRLDGPRGYPGCM